MIKNAVRRFAFSLECSRLWGVVFFDEFPDRWTLVGALVIVGAGLYVWHRETRLARAPTLPQV